MQSTYLHLLLFRGSPQGEKQKERSQWPGRDHHQTATPPRRSLSMPSPAPWSRTSLPDPDLTAKSSFFSSALRGGSEQTVAVPGAHAHHRCHVAGGVWRGVACGEACGALRAPKPPWA